MGTEYLVTCKQDLSLIPISITNTSHSSLATTSRLFLNQSLCSNESPTIHLPRKRVTTKYSYRTCPICSQRLLVRINGSFVYKWISTHFSTHHHEWMHVVALLFPTPFILFHIT
ncbi:hypothetical protein A0J61_07264 [Choanephora cucurbitarum]|uniref:Uncharacterized protein n=1 Tax=Choanephora cucurbitarum TaxID=101091 RepID=A0A1C7N6M8_9FUNG|nr:hypothetical protein A0J61_07264 [Choanephora cucurbitarum]